MADFDAVGQVTPVRSKGGRVRMLGVAFTTDGSGNATLVKDYGGAVSISRATNTYTISFGVCAEILATPFSHSEQSTLNVDLTKSASAGTVALAFSGALNSAQCDIVLVVTTSSD